METNKANSVWDRSYQSELTKPVKVALTEVKVKSWSPVLKTVDKKPIRTPPPCVRKKSIKPSNDNVSTQLPSPQQQLDTVAVELKAIIKQFDSKLLTVQEFMVAVSKQRNSLILVDLTGAMDPVTKVQY